MTTRTRRKTFFPVRLDEAQPEIIVPVSTIRADGGTVLTFESERYRGDRRLVRVFPNASRPWEILFLSMLRHRVDKWAPAHGDGILVAEDLISNLPTT